jgi:hypothetical protein
MTQDFQPPLPRRPDDPRNLARLRARGTRSDESNLTVVQIWSSDAPTSVSHHPASLRGRQAQISHHMHNGA